MSTLVYDRSTSRKPFVSTITFEMITEWFKQFGVTDEGYLRTHFGRFMQTKAFTFPDGSGHSHPLTILDIGAHWLHHAFLYANDGHILHCVDVRATITNPAVVSAAKAMGASLHVARNLELGDGISEIADSSIDAILFCEIIEHLTFNPIPMWKHIYRVLKPNARIILSTPNVNYWERRLVNACRILKGEGWGVPVSQLFSTGTFGHHWKEYSVRELKQYFSTLSADFRISREQISNINAPRPVPPESYLPFSVTDEAKFENIFLEVTLSCKDTGIAISPPWIPKYD